MRQAGLLLAAAAAACSTEESLVLVATPARAAADGVSIIELRAEVIFRDKPLADGKSVTFRADAPLLFESREAATPTTPDTRREGVTEVDPPSRGGAATAYLLAPTDVADITIEASFTTVNKDVLRDSVRVAFAFAPQVASGSRASPDFASVEMYFHFDCDAPSIGAFATPRPELRVPCSALVLKSPSGADLPHTPVHFFVEAGRIDDVPASDDEPRRVTYVVPIAPSRWPADVRPWSGEGWVRFGPGLIAGAQEQNPRDGLVTLLAVVRGEEALDDLNGNGTWDVGEFFIDEGEPFLDVDDDGIFTAGTDEACCDSNLNGSVDGGNGLWDGDVWIGRDTRILWTGPVDTTSGRSGIDPPDWQIAAQSSRSFVMTVVDGNGNPPAARASGDTMSATLQPSSHIAFEVPPSFAIHRGTGFAPGERYPWRLFGEEQPAVGTVLTEAVREHSFRLRDDRSTMSAAYCLPVAWTLEVDVRYTLGIDYSGADFTAQTATLAASGRLAAGSPAECPP